MTSRIDRLFGSKTRTLVLSILMTNPDRSFYLRELARQLQIPYSMLYKEVKNLALLDIVKEEKKGKITLITVNKQLPYLTELRNLIIKTAGMADILKDAFSEFKRLRYALIYGSFASGQETAASDVDILIIGEENEENILAKLNILEKKFGRELNYILWNQNEFSRRVKTRNHLLIDINSKPVIMLVGEEHEFRRATKKSNNQEDKTRQETSAEHS